MSDDALVGGGPRTHPSHVFGEFNEREDILSKRLDILLRSLESIESRVSTPLCFKWWGNSCHYHTFLEAIIFVIIEAGFSDVFSKSAFASAFSHVYDVSLRSDMESLSFIFRKWFNGDNIGDSESIRAGAGNGDAAHKSGEFDALSTAIHSVFNSDPLSTKHIRFFDREDSSITFSWDFLCSFCSTHNSGSDYIHSFWALTRQMRVSIALNDQRQRSCTLCHCPHQVIPIVQNVPKFFAVELTYKVGNCTFNGVSKNFILESEVELAPKKIFKLSAVIYCKNGNHFNSDAFRSFGGPTCRWCRIDDMSLTRPHFVYMKDPPSSNSLQYDQLTRRVPVALVYTRDASGGSLSLETLSTLIDETVLAHGRDEPMDKEAVYGRADESFLVASTSGVGDRLEHFDGIQSSGVTDEEFSTPFHMAGFANTTASEIITSKASRDCDPELSAPEVPSNCVELIVKIGNSQIYPRFLRGGTRPSCIRSLHVLSLEQQHQFSTQELLGDFKLGRLGILGDLDVGVPPSPTLFLQNTERHLNPSDIVAMHSVSKALLRHGFMLLSDIVDLYVTTKHSFLSLLKKDFPSSHSCVWIPSVEYSKRRVRLFILSSLSVIQVAVRLRSVASVSNNRQDWGLALLPNPVAMSLEALQHHLKGFYSIYDTVHDPKSERVKLLTRDDYNTLKSLVPAEVTALFDFILSKVNIDPAILKNLGISERRSISVMKRFNVLVEETAPRIRQRITEANAKRNEISISDVSLNSVVAAMRRASRSQDLLKNTLLATAAKLRNVREQMPALRDILQSAARSAGGISKTGCDNSYGTPTDAIILEAAFGSSGGMIDRMTLIAQHFLAENGLKRERSAIRSALRAYEIRFEQVKHTKTPLRLEQYYCAQSIQVQRQIAGLFSGYCRRASCDASKLFACDSLKNAGGALVMNIHSATIGESFVVEGPDHDSGGDHKSKLGAYGVFVLPSLVEDLQPAFGLFPPHFDASVLIKGWKEQDFVMSRKGLACVLGHVEREGGETAARDWQDRLEMISTYPEEFLSKEGGLVPIIFMEEDNAHGVADKHARFCLLIFADILGVDFLNDASNAAENSKYNAVEGMWGATRHRTGGPPIILDIPHWESATEAEKLSASQKACRVLMERFDGATFEAGGGMVNANVAGSVPTGWVYRDHELKKFFSLNTGPGFNGFAPINRAQLDFVCEPMPDFDGNPSEVLQRCWRKGGASGREQCFEVCLNSMTYAANPLNMDCAARRAPKVFWDFLSLFSPLGISMPQGVPSRKREGKLMRLDERIAEATHTTEDDNKLDAHHPVRKLMDIESVKHFIALWAAGTPMSEAHIATMATQLCVEVDVVRHHMKIAVFKLQRSADRALFKKALSLSGKKLVVCDYVRQRLGLVSVTQTLKSGKMNTTPAKVNKKHLLQALVLLGVATGKKNREVTEAHVPKLMAIIFDKAGLSTSMTSLALEPIVHDAHASEISSEIESVLADDDIEITSSMSDDDDFVESDDEEKQVQEEAEEEEEEAEEAVDLATRLEAAVTVGSGFGRGCRIRKRKKLDGEEEFD